MQNDGSSIEVALTQRFQRDLRTLAKRYRRIRSDLQPLVEQLQMGDLPGDRIAGIEYTLFKVRLKNSDIQKGKSAGYRVVYYLETQAQIVLVTIYSKSDQASTEDAILRDAILRYEQEN